DAIEIEPDVDGLPRQESEQVDPPRAGARRGGASDEARTNVAKPPDVHAVAQPLLVGGRPHGVETLHGAGRDLDALAQRRIGFARERVVRAMDLEAAILHPPGPDVRAGAHPDAIADDGGRGPVHVAELEVDRLLARALVLEEIGRSPRAAGHRPRRSPALPDRAREAGVLADAVFGRRLA